jgi:predicted permease
MLEILQVIIPILIIAFIGYIFGHFRKIELKTIADIIIYISTPALAITQLSSQRMEVVELSSIVFAAVLIILGSGLITYFLLKAFKISAKAGIYLPVMFMNSAFIGYPLALFAFGKVGLNKAIIYDITNAILIFTVGIYIVSSGRDRWQVLKIPFIYAALAGLVLSFTRIQIPAFINLPLNMLGETTIPLALFMLGCRLANLKVSSWKIPLIAASLRIGLGLVLSFLAVFLFKLSGVAAKVVILISILPSAITAIALAEEYESESDVVASTIALSMLLSMFVVIAIIYFMLP